MILGIDYNGNSLKIAEFDDCKKLTAWSSERIAPESPERSLDRILVNQVKSRKFKAQQAIIAVSGPELVYQLLELPVLPENEIPSAVKYKLEPTLPFSVDEAIINYTRIAGIHSPGKQFFLSLAVPQKYIRNLIATVRRTGLAIKDIIPSACALRNVPGTPVDEPFALVNLGRHSMLVVMMKNNECVFARDVKIGGEDIIHSIIGEIVQDKVKTEIDHAKAEEMIEKYGIPLVLEEYTRQTGFPADELFALMKPVLENIEVEIIRTVEYYRERTGDQSDFKLIYFTGESSGISNFISYFQGGTMVPEVKALPINILSDISAAKSSLPALAIAIGAVQPVKHSLSLLPEEYKNALKNIGRRLFNYWSAGLCYLILLGLVFGCQYLYLSRQNDRVRDLANQLEKKGQALKQKGYASPILQKVEKEIGHHPGNTDRFIKIIGMLHRSMPENIFIEQVTYDNRSNKLLIRGIMAKSAENNEVSALVEKLKSKSLFTVIDLSGLKESERFAEPAYEFELRCSIGE